MRGVFRWFMGGPEGRTPLQRCMDIAVFLSVVWLSLTLPLLLLVIEPDLVEDDPFLDVVLYLAAAGLIFKFGLWVFVFFGLLANGVIAGREREVSERPWTVALLLFGILSAVAALLILLVAGPYGQSNSHELLIALVLGFAVLAVTFALAVRARLPQNAR